MTTERYMAVATWATMTTPPRRWTMDCYDLRSAYVIGWFLANINVCASHDDDDDADDEDDDDYQDDGEDEDDDDGEEDNDDDCGEDDVEAGVTPKSCRAITRVVASCMVSPTRQASWAR